MMVEPNLARNFMSPRTNLQPLLVAAVALVMGVILTPMQVDAVVDAEVAVTSPDKLHPLLMLPKMVNLRYTPRMASLRNIAPSVASLNGALMTSLTPPQNTATPLY